jgi:hypothetical protein
VKRALVAGSLAVICIAFGIWWFSGTQVLKRRTRALLDTVTVDAGSGKIARGLQASGIDGFLAPTIKLAVPSDLASGTWSRDEVAAGFRYVAEAADSTRFEIRDLESVAITGDRATVVAVLDANVHVDRQARIDGPYRTEFDWQKIDGRWRIARVAMTGAN